MTTVEDVMTTDIVAVEPGVTIAEAAAVMGARHVGSALVMDGGSLAGIFTERDIMKALSQEFDAPSHLVSEWMTRNPATVSAGVDAGDALRRMLDGGFRHLPVVDGQSVVGIVSLRDLSRVAADG